MDATALTDDDYSLLATHQHERLRSQFPAELQDATLLTRHDATLAIACDWEAIALLNEDWDGFAQAVYELTGCSCTTFFVKGQQVLTQTRAIQLAQTVIVEGQAMVATAERKQSKQAAVKQFQAAAAAVVAANEPTRTLAEPLPRSIADVLNELTDMLAAQVTAKVEARTPSLVSSQMATSTPEQAPILEAATPEVPAVPEVPAKLPTVRLRGIYTPAASNFVQSAKRYLKAVDPTGNAAKALKEIIAQSPTGLAHLDRAVKAYPAELQEKARIRLKDAFTKISNERSTAAAE